MEREYFLDAENTVLYNYRGSLHEFFKYHTILPTVIQNKIQYFQLRITHSVCSALRYRYSLHNAQRGFSTVYSYIFSIFRLRQTRRREQKMAC
jgi:hypothetical protein